ncbi:MAG: glycosyltransferase [Pseudomonadota bacterium]
MIFLTVGSHEPFDRLVRGVDLWCGAAGKGDQVMGQITARANYRPKHFRSVESLEPEAFSQVFEEAACIVSHAGMGTIISALDSGKPIAVMPRRGHLNETRNDHQYATTRQFADYPGLLVAESEEDLAPTLDRLISLDTTNNAIPRYADTALLGALRSIIHLGGENNGNG